MSPFSPTPETTDEGHYFTIQELRDAAAELISVTKYPDAVLERHREEAELDFEELARRAFVPRTSVCHRHGGEEYVFSSYRDVRTLVGVTDAAGESVDTTGVVVDPVVGGFKHPGVWPTGLLRFEFTHGWDEPNAPVKRAVLLLAKVYTLPYAIDPRATAVINTETGGYRISVADKERGYCGIPDVDAAAARWGARKGCGVG